MNYEPLGNYVVVEPPEIGEKTEGGIYKPYEVIEQEMEQFSGKVKVLEVGEGVKNIEPGEVVHIPSRFHAEIIKTDIGEVWQFRATDIIGKYRVNVTKEDKDA